MATALTPPGGGKGVLTVADEDADRYVAQGWVRADGQGSGTLDPEPTVKITDTGGGPEADDEDIDYVRTVVSDNLGDEDVLVTDFGRPGDEPVKGVTDRLEPATEDEIETGTDRSADTDKQKTARTRGSKQS